MMEVLVLSSVTQIQSVHAILEAHQGQDTFYGFDYSTFGDHWNLYDSTREPVHSATTKGIGWAVHDSFFPKLARMKDQH